ncbi:hypothetical protein GF373_06990 [bacterium]|nr:hypothetical protein [bacterium]
MNGKQIVIISLCLFGLITGGAAETPLRLTIDGDQLQVHKREQVILNYAYNNVPFKPYVKELYTPSGINILRDAPADHLHHHGLMFAVAVDGISFWGETNKDGRQVHRDFSHVRVKEGRDAACASFTESLVWKTPADANVLREERTLRVYPSTKHQAVLLSWNSTCRVADGKERVEIGGSHYYGLGMRFLKEMDASGTFYNAQGTTGPIFRGQERLAPAEWCAYEVDVKGRPITIAMFDHPTNWRAATWFTMPAPFAYISATLRYHEQPLQLKEDNQLNLTYGIAVIEGVGKRRVEPIHKFWLTQMAGSE